MIFRAWDRVMCLLAVGFASSNCLLNAPVAKAAWSPSSVWVESVTQQRAGPFDLQNKNATAATVEDVQGILTEGKAEDRAENKAAGKRKSDAEVARQLSGLELTERMSSAKLSLLKQSAPGSKSRRALLALADTSVFLGPPAADVPSQVSPDANEQRHMLGLTVGYIAKTLHKLPNFYATRTIVRFEAMQSGRRARAESRNDASWRQVGSSRVVVAYRDGKEVVDPREWGQHPHHPEGEGLITRGTFGPILSIAFVDAVHSGGFSWSRWERESAGTAGVFRYRVPKDQSHYSVGTHGLSNGVGDVAHVTGYHGEVAIDPVTGTILRLTVQADQSLESAILRSDIMVEYGPVEIGGKTYTCPIRSVSISMRGMGVMGVYPFGRSASTSDATLLNDVVFENYHQFRSESRILTGIIPVPDH